MVSKHGTDIKGHEGRGVIPVEKKRPPATLFSVSNFYCCIKKNDKSVLPEFYGLWSLALSEGLDEG